ncbi:hypothetical protein [Rhizobium leguminosarum]|uniref:hypothetical protein n=1 Tax=Rhizobium leguminosarum TaxID=384 RepID=UPI001FF01841|nr:hypothetical protein [Rhizobium leguminosarum]
MAVEYTIPGMLIRDHMVGAPLDWSKPEGETIRIFARELCDPACRRDEFEHDGVCQSAAVLRRLMTLVREQGGLPRLLRLQRFHCSRRVRTY